MILRRGYQHGTYISYAHHNRNYSLPTIIYALSFQISSLLMSSIPNTLLQVLKEFFSIFAKNMGQEVCVLKITPLDGNFHAILQEKVDAVFNSLGFSPEAGLLNKLEEK